jgi:hypothetical protein
VVPEENTGDKVPELSASPDSVAFDDSAETVSGVAVVAVLPAPDSDDDTAPLVYE